MRIKNVLASGGVEMNETTDMYEIEKRLHGEGYKFIAGVDEAGRGPLAGDVYAAAVILDDKNPIEGLNDSKKLTEKKREALYDEIIKKALAYCVCPVSAEEIDQINILNATFKAMNGAVDGLKIKPDYVIIDGNRIKGMEIAHETVVKGDALSASIAAASILAKVSRDRYMLKMAEKSPEYNFEKHKAYGTKEHMELIKKYGPSPIHRKSFKGVKEYAED